MSSKRLAMKAVLVLVLVGLALQTGCGPKRPVLYPNAKYNEAGQARAQQDIAECEAIAKQNVKSTAAREAAKDTAIGAAGGAAVGAVGGAIAGSAGMGAAVGAGSGATAGLLGGLWKAKEPEPLYVEFVNACLQERGYQPLGWQ